MQDQIGERRALARPPTPRENLGSRFFVLATYLFAWLTVILVLYIVITIGVQAAPAIKDYGAAFLTGTTWDNNRHQYGILPYIWGTIYSSLLALGLGSFF
ncbi:MAG: phosphate ABC transporter permease subunit PstC, partial [Desulfomonilaceae bacterium]